MGYRYHFHEVDKNLINEIRKCESVDDFVSTMIAYDPSNKDYVEEGSFFLHELGEEIFDLGGHYENANEVSKHGIELFTTNELNEFYQEYKAVILNKKGVLCAIEYMRNKIVSIYEDLLKEDSNDKISQLDRMKIHAHEYLNRWKPSYGNFTAYDLDENRDNLAMSQLYEHQIFDLVRIYKTFDWENKCIIFLGW
jgi:hypothetical protein